MRNVERLCRDRFPLDAHEMCLHLACGGCASHADVYLSDCLSTTERRLHTKTKTTCATRKMEEVENDTLVGIAECMANPGRVVARHSFAYVDDKESISEELADCVVTKAFPLEVEFSLPGSAFVKPGEGQVGLLRRNSLKATSPGGSPQFAVTPVTTKHNLRNLLNEPKYAMEARGARLLLQGGDRLEGWMPLLFDDLNRIVSEEDRKELRDGVFWRYGHDVSFGKTIGMMTDGITVEASSFQLVRDDFVVKPGQRVGIAVYMKRKVSLAMAQHSETFPLRNVKEKELAHIFGTPGNVHIYTGKITFAGDNHVEYDLNSFTSCSGSLVFLLDKQQPEESVRQEDYGKVIAVHAGAHPTLTNRNLGFRMHGTNLP